MEDVDQDFYKPYLDMIVEGTKPNPRKIKRVCNLIELQRRLDEAINPNKKEKYSPDLFVSNQEWDDFVTRN